MSTRSIRHVQLIVTGDLERKALEAALRRAFSGAQRDADVWQTSKAEGATTETLRLLQPGEEPVTRKGKLQAIEKLADRLVTSVWTTFPHGRGDKRPDLVLVVDDLELANIHQPEIVIARWRQGSPRPPRPQPTRACSTLMSSASRSPLPSTPMTIPGTPSSTSPRCWMGKASSIRRPSTASPRSTPSAGTASPTPTIPKPPPSSAPSSRIWPTSLAPPRRSRLAQRRR